jgi:membrane protein
VITAALFTVGKFLIGLYLGKSNIGSSFGAFGSLVIVMVWVYYSGQIFLLGAEFTWVYAHQSGSRRNEKRRDAPVAADMQPVVVPKALPPLPMAQPTRKPAFKLALAAGLGAALGLLGRRVLR